MNEEDLREVADEFRRTGFTGGLNWYRAIRKDIRVDGGVARLPNPSAFAVHRALVQTAGSGPAMMSAELPEGWAWAS